MKLALRTLAVIGFAGVSSAWAQVSLTGLSYSQNFDSIGSTATASLPSGWKMSAAGASSPSWSDSGNFTATLQQASSGSPTAGSRYNWGTSSTERAIGFMTSGSYASPNSIMLAVTNNTGSTLTSLALIFDYERYRINTAAASVSFFVSTNGSTWTSVTQGDSGAFTTGTSAYSFTPLTAVSKSFSITSLNISDGSSYYFRWNFNTTGTNSQGLGLDNFSLTATAIPEPSTYAAAFGGLILLGVMMNRRRSV